MPPPLSDGTAITVTVGWAVSIIALLMALASSSGVLLYQVSELRKETARLAVQQQASERAIIELTVTLRTKGLIAP